MTKHVFDFPTMDFSRVAIIGSAGSGKTTFAKTLGKLLDRQPTHLDKILWGENWTELTNEQHVQILEPIVNAPTWIIDGMWSKTLDMRYKNATLVVFLDYKPALCAWRAFWRSVKHGGKQRDDLATGCVERVDPQFYKYILNFRKGCRLKVVQAQQDYPNVPIISFKNPKQTKAFLTQLQEYLNRNNQQHPNT